MAEVYVNRNALSLEADTFPNKSTNLDNLETVSSLPDNETSKFKKSDYISIEAGLMNAANNRDFYALDQMLVPLINNKHIDFLDSVCALHWCCFSGHVDLVNKLLDAGSDPFLPDPINHETPVYYAIKSSNAYIISILLKRFGPLILCHENLKFKTPFLVAVSEFTDDDLVAVLHVLEFLYLSGVSLEEQDNNGTTSLMFACKRGQLFVVQWLLKKGADLSHRDHFGATVLHYAAMSPNLDVLLFLSQSGLAPLIHVKSINNSKFNHVFDQTPLEVCKEAGNHLRYLLLWVCWLQWKVFGKVFKFNTFYPVLYWIMSIFNLFLLFPMMDTVYHYRHSNGLFYLCLSFSTISHFLWILNKISDPGVSTDNSNNQAGVFSPKNNLNLTPFEGVLDSLHKRQQMVNFEFYCINKDLKKHFLGNIVGSKGGFWKRFKSSYNDDMFQPLNDEELGNPFISRVDMCNEELNNITTEIRSVYPQVANERCNKNCIEYNKAVLNFDNSNKICLTCGKTKSMREHHCSLCNTCLVHQDHHCGWVDNCVGSGNQKLFFVFVSFLGTAFFYYYLFFFQYFSAKFITGLTFFDLFIFLNGAFANGVFFFFVLYLWLRIVRSMVTDVTYYEYLKKPSHIRVRYKGNVHEKFWDFKGLSLKLVYNNVIKFWTYKTHHYEAECT